MKIAVMGLGCVGLPLAQKFARSGITVLGLDVDAAKVKAVNAGQSHIKHIEAGAVAGAVQAGRFSASTDFSRIRDVEAVLICVPVVKTREGQVFKA